MRSNVVEIPSPRGNETGSARLALTLRASLLAGMLARTQNASIGLGKAEGASPRLGRMEGGFG